jgi:sulfate/thiosulfate transport system permease protein
MNALISSFLRLAPPSERRLRNSFSAALGPAARRRHGGVALRWVAIVYVGLLVVLPLSALVAKGVGVGPNGIVRALSAPTASAALWLTVWTAALMSVINAVMGTFTAWLLVRHQFPGRRFLSALVDLPLAIPTLVAGMMIVVLLGPQSALGGYCARHGVDIVFATPGIVLALLFINLPMVVRAVEPVMRELDPAEQEAAHTLGASDVRIYFQLLLPPLLPAIVTGTLQSFARALAEFGSIVVVSGNIPFRTLTSPVYIFGEVESGAADTAAAVSLVLLALATVLLLAVRGLERYLAAHKRT